MTDDELIKLSYKLTQEELNILGKTVPDKGDPLSYFLQTPFWENNARYAFIKSIKILQERFDIVPKGKKDGQEV